MDFDVLFTVLFWAAGLCLVFWLGLLLAGLAGEMTADEPEKNESREMLSRRDSPA